MLSRQHRGTRKLSTWHVDCKPEGTAIILATSIGTLVQQGAFVGVAKLSQAMGTGTAPLYGSPIYEPNNSAPKLYSPNR